MKKKHLIKVKYNQCFIKLSIETKRRHNLSSSHVKMSRAHIFMTPTDPCPPQQTRNPS